MKLKIYQSLFKIVINHNKFSINKFCSLKNKNNSKYELNKNNDNNKIKGNEEVEFNTLNYSLEKIDKLIKLLNYNNYLNKYFDNLYEDYLVKYMSKSNKLQDDNTIKKDDEVNINEPVDIEFKLNIINKTFFSLNDASKLKNIKNFKKKSVTLTIENEYKSLSLALIKGFISYNQHLLSKKKEDIFDMNEIEENKNNNEQDVSYIKILSTNKEDFLYSLFNDSIQIPLNSIIKEEIKTRITELYNYYTENSFEYNNDLQLRKTTIKKLKFRNNLKDDINYLSNNCTEAINIRVFVDGGCRGKNIGYVGVSIYIENENIIQLSGNIGNYCTNNKAEYFSMLFALILLDFVNFNKIVENFINISFFADSELMIKQIKQEYLVKNRELVYLNSICLIIINKLEQNNMKIYFNHVKRNLNQEADALTILANDLKNSTFKIMI